MTGSGHNLNTSLKACFERLGMGCKRNREVKDGIQILGQSNPKLYHQGEGEALGSSKFRRQMGSLVVIMSSPL